MKQGKYNLHKVKFVQQKCYIKIFTKACQRPQNIRHYIKCSLKRTELKVTGAIRFILRTRT